MAIEINCRLGGAECPASVEAVLGECPIAAGARLALGMPDLDFSELEDFEDESPFPCLDPNYWKSCRRRYAVCSTINLYLDRAGELTELSFGVVDARDLKLVGCVMYGAKGKQYSPGNGSKSCLGWIACGGDTAAEAEDNLRRAVAQVSISLDHERMDFVRCGALSGKSDS